MPGQGRLLNYVQGDSRASSPVKSVVVVVAVALVQKRKEKAAKEENWKVTRKTYSWTVVYAH